MCKILMGISSLAGFMQFEPFSLPDRRKELFPVGKVERRNMPFFAMPILCTIVQLIVFLKNISMNANCSRASNVHAPLPTQPHLLIAQFWKVYMTKSGICTPACRKVQHRHLRFNDQTILYANVQYINCRTEAAKNANHLCCPSRSCLLL